MQFSYEEQCRSFLESLWRESDLDGVFGELADLIPPDGEEGASPKVAMIKSLLGEEGASPEVAQLEAIQPPMREEGASPKVAMIKSLMEEEGASPKAGQKVANWSVEILAHTITVLKRSQHGDDLAGQLLQLAEQLQNGTLNKRAGVMRLCEVALQQRDGCLEASYVLQCILRRNQSDCLNAAMAFLDVAKAFDTVSCDTIIRAAAAHGAAPELQRYLRVLYTSSRLLHGNEVLECHRGVRQGDLLSPLFFIMVMDEVVAATVPNRGGGCVFVAMRLALSAKLVALQQSLSAAGMSLNASKCRAITVQKLGKQKCVVLVPQAYPLQGGKVSPVAVTDEIRYLGLRFKWKGRCQVRSTAVLAGWSNEISRAPLKLQQRLDMVRDFGFPKMPHELVLGNAHRNTLRQMDKMVRSKVREWMRYPKDVSLPFFYTSRGLGGLGLLSWSILVPFSQRAKFGRLCSSPSSLVRGLLESAACNVDIRSAHVPVRLMGTVMEDKKAV
ncbi:unnamed protein product [Dicrocoelium dendriticum]|nr:unnamed protein product [Dicrocoelium dendriticum]